MHSTEPLFELCDHDKDHPYVMISREMAQDKSISPKAKGVLLYLLSLPKDWKIYHSQLQKGLGVGEDYINSSMEELINSGYASRSRERVKGVFQPYKYKISEFKKFPPNLENRPGSAGPENPGLQKTEIQSKDLQKKQQHSEEAKPPVPAAASFKSEISQEKSGIYPCLDAVGIPIHDKTEITRTYSLEKVHHALAWLEANKAPLKNGVAAALKWACKIQPKIPMEKSSQEHTNKAYAMQYDEMKLGDAYKITALSKHIEIDFGTPYKAPYCLEYTANGFKDQLDSALRKHGFKILD